MDLFIRTFNDYPFEVCLYALTPIIALSLMLIASKVADKAKGQLRSRCTYKVKGVCTKRYSKLRRYTGINTKTGSHIFYYNDWIYTFNGKQHRGTTMEEYKSLWCEVNEETDLLINPNRPNEVVKLEDFSECETNEKEHKFGIAIQLVLLFLIWLLVGIILICQ